MSSAVTSGTDNAAYGRENPPVYEPVAGWGLVPHGLSFGGDANAVAVDSQDRVYVFNRGQKPMVVFERDGHYSAAWGEDIYTDLWG